LHASPLGRPQQALVRHPDRVGNGGIGDPGGQRTPGGARMRQALDAPDGLGCSIRAGRCESVRCDRPHPRRAGAVRSALARACRPLEADELHCAVGSTGGLRAVGADAGPPAFARQGRCAGQRCGSWTASNLTVTHSSAAAFGTKAGKRLSWCPAIRLGHASWGRRRLQVLWSRRGGFWPRLLSARRSGAFPGPRSTPPAVLARPGSAAPLPMRSAPNFCDEPFPFYDLRNAGMRRPPRVTSIRPPTSSSCDHCSHVQGRLPRCRIGNWRSVGSFAQRVFHRIVSSTRAGACDPQTDPLQFRLASFAASPSSPRGCWRWPRQESRLGAVRRPPGRAPRPGAWQRVVRFDRGAQVAEVSMQERAAARSPRGNGAVRTAESRSTPRNRRAADRRGR